MVDSGNPFAFLLRKRSKCLDAPFYRSARSFADIDDEMRLNLLELVPSGRGAYGPRVRRLLARLSPALSRHFLVRWFDSEWGSAGMEGLCTTPDWLEVLPEMVAAFAELGAVKHAALIESLPPVVRRAHEASTETKQDAMLPEFKSLDRQWKALEKTENLQVLLFKPIRSDYTRYLHPEPQRQAAARNLKRTGSTSSDCHG